MRKKSTMTKTRYLFTAVFFLAITAGAIAAMYTGAFCANTDVPAGGLPETSRAQAYTVVGEDDFSADYGRIRKAWCIASDARSFTARAHTTIQAAIDLQQQYDADFVRVAMTPVKQAGCDRYYAAMAEYAPAGQQTDDEKPFVWRVRASDVVLNAEERLVAIAWEEARSRFETGGEVDVEKMTRYLAGQLNLSPAEVKDYWLESVEMKMTLRSYPVKTNKAPR
ncbi:MAG: hypothetical protein ACQERN_09980 [Thermodesulfobacteriota bacterium]